MRGSLSVKGTGIVAKQTFNHKKQEIALTVQGGAIYSSDI